VKPELAEAAGAIGSCLWGLSGAVGLAAIFVLVARLAHFWAGLGALLIGVTAPIFYVPPPASSGRGGAWIPTAVAVAGLALAALGPGARWMRGCAIALGVVALAYGYHCVGPLIGVFLPSASVALAWLLTERAKDGRAAAWLACAAGGAALALEAHAALASFADAPHPALAATARSTHRTFDFPLAELGRVFFPWSALLPASLAAMSELPVSSLRAPAATPERQSALRVLLLAGTALSYAVSALPTARPQPFAGLVFVAGAVGLWLWDIGRGARVSRPAVFASTSLVMLLGFDFLRLPETHALTFAPTFERASERAFEQPLAPGRPPAQPVGPSGPNDPGTTALVAAVLLTSAGCACGALQDSRRARVWCTRFARRAGLARCLRGARAPRVLLFAGALLAALLIRCADQPAAPGADTPTVAEGG
jgi:hypothetical protein